MDARRIEVLALARVVGLARLCGPPEKRPDWMYQQALVIHHIAVVRLLAAIREQKRAREGQG